MRVTALYDFHFGNGNAAEIITRGTSFTPPGTGQMNVLDHAQSLIAQGAAVPESEFAKASAKTEAGYEWAKAEAALMNARGRK